MLTTAEQRTIVENLRAFVRIDSRSSPAGGSEGALQRLIAEKLRAAGARVRTFEADDIAGFRDHPLCHGPRRDYRDRPTVVGELGPSDPDAPALLVLAHSDTVQVYDAPRWTIDPWSAELRDGAVHGLGASDDKWGLAALVLCARRFASTKLAKRLVFASTIDEEHGVCNGPLLLMLAGIKADAALYLDGNGMRVLVGTCGGSTVFLRPRGGDADLPRDLTALSSAAAALSKRREPLFDALPEFRGNFVRDRSIQAAHRSDVTGDYLVVPFYTLPGEDRGAMAQAMRQLIDGALGERAARYEQTFREPWFEPAISPATPLVGLVHAQMRRVLGRETDTTTVTKQDNFLLINHARIPTVSFGPGMRRIGVTHGAPHQPDEFLTLDELFAGIDVAVGAVEAWLNS